MSHRRYRYLFVDILSNRVIDELPCYGTWFSRQLSGAGNMTATIALNAKPYKNIDIKNATTPGKTALYALCNDVCVWGGPIWTRTYSPTAHTIQLSGQTWESWLSKFYPDNSLSYTNTDQRNIVVDLITRMQAVSLQNAQFTLPSTFPLSIPRTENFPFSDLKSYGELVEYLSEYDDGFDYEILPYMDGSGILQRYVNLGNPKLGTSQSNSNLVFDYPGGITTYWYSENASAGAVKVYGVGGTVGEATDPIRSSYTQLDIAVLGSYPLFQEVFTNGDVTVQSTLDSQTKLFGNTNRVPIVSWTIDVDPSLDPVLGTWALGDHGHVMIEDNAFWDTPLSTYVRIIGWELTPPASDAVESLKLVLEGSDNSGG
jgi:hypothetical protein